VAAETAKTAGGSGRFAESIYEEQGVSVDVKLWVGSINLLGLYEQLFRERVQK
jgi:hypothetical protein